MGSPAVPAGLKWDARGLIPAVAQDARTGVVLMLAWQNAEALRLTLATHEAHFFSRSRDRLWKKGETSGHILTVRDVRADCDGDAILMLVEPRGPACHTGKTSCFHNPVGGEPDDAPPAGILVRLAQVIESRRADGAPRSYTRSLLEAGLPKILGKIAEEQQELAVELTGGPPEKIVHETADLLYHVLVGLSARRVPLADVLAELERRFGVSGLDEKSARPSSSSREP